MMTITVLLVASRLTVTVSMSGEEVVSGALVVVGLTDVDMRVDDSLEEAVKGFYKAKTSGPLLRSSATMQTQTDQWSCSAEEVENPREERRKRVAICQSWPAW